MNIYLYIDDIREDKTLFNQMREYTGMGQWIYIKCAHAEEAEWFLNYYNNSSDNFIIIDLDHDLGAKKSGYDICKYIVENHISLLGFHIHSMNPVGVANMRQLLTHYGYREI